MQTPSVVVVVRLGDIKKYSMANSWSGPREANEKLPLTHFHLEGEKTFGQRPRQGRVCISCEALADFPLSPVCKCTHCPSQGLKIQLAIT